MSEAPLFENALFILKRMKEMQIEEAQAKIREEKKEREKVLAEPTGGWSIGPLRKRASK